MKWSALDRAIAAWVCILATCAIIIVLAGLSEIIGENSSNIASWVQALGSIIAIWSGFHLSRKTLHIQNEQQLQRDKERDRCKERIQYCILADVLNLGEAWAAAISQKVLEIDLDEIIREISIGESVIKSLRSFTPDQIPSVEAIRRINMAAQSAEIVVVNLKSLRRIYQFKSNENLDNARALTLLRAQHLRNVAAVDRDFCNTEADMISTPEEITKRRQAEMSRAQELAKAFVQDTPRVPRARIG
jgi:hypothetical protein